jgi:hypothetical protein
VYSITDAVERAGGGRARFPLVVDAERFADGPDGRLAVEVIQAQRVAQHVRDAAAEAIQLAQPLLAHRQEELRVHVPAVHGARELRVKAVVLRGGRVVEEILFELVEDEEDGTVGGLDALGEEDIQGGRLLPGRALLFAHPEFFDGLPLRLPADLF